MDWSVPEKVIAPKDSYRGFFETGLVVSPEDCAPSAFRDFACHVDCIASASSLNPYILQHSEKRSPYAAADAFVNAALEAGLSLCGATLVWNGQLPAIFPGADPESFVRHIGDACLHFSGRVRNWTVVSEALGAASGGSWRQSLRDCPWMEVFGGGLSGSYYVDVAFRTARGTAPEARLYYGENIFDSDGHQGILNHHKLQNLILLVSDINRSHRAEGYGRDLIEGLSLRGAFSTETAASEVETALRRLAPLGLGIEISSFRVKAAPTTRDKSPHNANERIEEKTAELLCLFRQWPELIDRVLFGEPLMAAPDRYYALSQPERYIGRAAPDAPPPPRRHASAAYGTPLIDGVVDEAWQRAERIELNGFRQGWPSAHGTARVLWDERYLYVLAEVQDETQDCSSPLAYEHDSVEVYVSESGHYEREFTTGDGLYRVDCENNRSVGLYTRELRFETAVNATAGGYTVEMRIPWRSREPYDGMIIGFEVQINDSEGSTRVGRATWHEREGEAWVNPMIWGRLRLRKNGDRPDELLERRDMPDAPAAKEPVYSREDIEEEGTEAVEARAEEQADAIEVPAPSNAPESIDLDNPCESGTELQDAQTQEESCDMPPEDTEIEEAVPGEAPQEDMPPEEEIPEDAVPKDDLSEEAQPGEESAPQEDAASPEGTPSEEEMPEDVPQEDIPPEGESTPEEVPPEEVISEDVPQEDIPSEEASAAPAAALSLAELFRIALASPSSSKEEGLTPASCDAAAGAAAPADSPAEPANKPEQPANGAAQSGEAEESGKRTAQSLEGQESIAEPEDEAAPCDADETRERRLRTAVKALEVLTMLDGAEAALESIQGIEEVIAATGNFAAGDRESGAEDRECAPEDETALPEKDREGEEETSLWEPDLCREDDYGGEPAKQAFPVATQQTVPRKIQRRYTKLPLLLGAAGLGAAAYTIWRLSQKRK